MESVENPRILSSMLLIQLFFQFYIQVLCNILCKAIRVLKDRQTRHRSSNCPKYNRGNRHILTNMELGAEHDNF